MSTLPATAAAAAAALPDWAQLDPDHDAMCSHVLLYRGFDLSAVGIWAHQLAPCLYCGNRRRPDEPALILTDEVLSWGRVVHFACCGDCGTRGPWADSESQALALWNAAHERHNAELTGPLAHVRRSRGL